MAALALLCMVSVVACSQVTLAKEIGLSNVSSKDLQKALADTKEGMMDAFTDMSELFLKTSQLDRLKKHAQAAQKRLGDESDDDDDDDEVGQGIGSSMLYSMSKTATGVADALPAAYNQLLERTRLNEMGIPSIEDSSEVKDTIRGALLNAMMGLGVATAAYGNLVSVVVSPLLDFRDARTGAVE